MDAQIVNINEYRLVAGADRFVEAISAVAQRAETEGEPGVLRYQFYVSRDDDTAVATIVYRDAEAWLAHHRMAYEWPEMTVFQSTVQLQRLTLLGPLNDEIEAMVAAVSVPVSYCDTLAAGFARTS